MQLDEFADLITPSQTSLLLGAGASVSSGAPTGAQLARFLASRLPREPDGDDLSEIAAIFENRLGRKALIEAIRTRLGNLHPTRGMLALPEFDWRAIYTTNFDRLVEESYQKASRDLVVVRSNYDFGPAVNSAQHLLFKMHGCITQDVADGSRSRLLLTEADYDQFAMYRQALFTSLQQNMLTADTVIIGQSLRDPHLRAIAKEVAELRQQGVQGRVFLLVYQYDDDRAQLYAQKGIQAVGGDLEAFLHSLATKAVKRSTPKIAYSATSVAPDSLPPELATITLDVKHAATLPPNPIRLFNGAAATYADIRAGFTIKRAIERRLDESQRTGSRRYFVVLQGAAGVGKTSLARRLLLLRSEGGFACWEHLNDFALDVDAWLAVESNLRKAGRQGILLIDDCARHMAAVNRLVEALGQIDRPFLLLVVTVNAGQWRTRTKSKYFFSRGTLERLSRLTDGDIEEMLNLVDSKTEIRSLVEDDFLHLGRSEKARRLKDRCSADMFVCLKNIFGSDRLDEILLQEFAELDEPARDVYRYVSAVQAMGGRVHRQLIMRLLFLDGGTIRGLLAQMDSVVEEYDVEPRKGLYGWTTRHDVIAQVIATYKFADQGELYALLEHLIDGLNPTVAMELETARAISAHEMGIFRLLDKGEKVALLQKLINIVPSERTPRRRLIRLYLDHGNLNEADRAIHVANRDIGRDDIIDRYTAILAMSRAQQLTGLLPEDRHAMLLEAERIARACISRRPADRFNYRVLGDVGVILAENYSDFSVIDDAVEMMKASVEDIQDPDFDSDRRQLEARQRAARRRHRNEGRTPLGDLDETALVDSDG